MQVICVDNTNENKECPTPVLGDTYTVINERMFNNREHYEFAEINAPGVHYWYCKKRFIPLSSIDETEFERSYDHSMDWFDKLFIEPLKKHA